MSGTGLEQRGSMADKPAVRTGRHDLEAAGPDGIRNVVLIGPSSSGKTTFLETLLVTAGAISRAGSVDEGTTVSDFEDSERGHGRSMGLAVTPVRHRGTKINFVDTPGYADFVGELRAGLRAADCALFVVAANEGVDHTTAGLWQECARVAMPRAVVVTKLDHARADYPGVLAQAQAAFGDKVLPVFLPVSEGGSVVGLAGPARRKPHRGRGRRAPSGADRGDHRGVRGRDPDGPLPRRRGDRRRRARRRPGAGDGAGLLPSGGAGLRVHRGGVRRAARPGRERVPGAVHPPEPGGVHAQRRGRRPAVVRPGRAAGGRGREDDQRPVRRPGQPGARLLRHPRRRQPGARVRPLLVVLRRRLGPRRPRRRRAGRLARLPLRPAAGAGQAGRRRRHRHHRPADPGRDRRHPLRGRRAPGAPAVDAAAAAASRRDRGHHQVRRGQALHRPRPAGRRGPVGADRQRPRDPAARRLGDGRGARRRRARAAAGPVRRVRGDGRPRRTPAGDVRRPRPPGSAGTSSSPAGTASTPSATSRWSRCRRARGSSSPSGSSAGRCRSSSSPASRRACARRWSAASATATRSSTSGSRSPAARRTASTPPTWRSRAPVH